MSEEVLRRAKVLAAQRDMSVSSPVARLLEQLVGDVRDYDDMWHLVALTWRVHRQTGEGCRILASV